METQIPADLLKILRENYTDSALHTHVSLIKPKGKYQLGRSSFSAFWDSYCSAIYTHGTDIKIGIAEKPQEYLPVIVDVDLRIREEYFPDLESLYTENQLKSIVTIYQSVLRNIIEDCNENNLMCVCLEKKMYKQTKNNISYFKHGFHLHFPYTFLNKEYQEVHIIPRVQALIKEQEIFKEIGVEDSGSVIDKACCKVPWLLYGSRKENSEPYVLTKIFNSSLQEITIEQAFRDYQLFDHREQLIQIQNPKKELPRILSIIPFGRKNKEIKRGLSSVKKENIKIPKESSANHLSLPLQETLDICKKLLPLLADFRAFERNEWINIGWILFNVTDGHPDGLDLWLDFSARCEEKYDESFCIHTWGLMVKKDLSLGTLKHFASIDSPEEYKKFKKEQAEKFIISSVEGSHNDIAKALYEEYGDEFVCASITYKIWFQFINHRWIEVEDGTFLREKISGKMVDRFIEARNYVNTLEGKAQEKGEMMMYATKAKQYGKMIQNLKNANFKNSVMKECMEVFYDQRFREKLDSDPYLICFKNGVYDLKNNIFRAGKPEDFISKAMPINYTVFSEDDERLLEVHTFLEQVFPDKSVREYFLNTASDVFVGGNQEKTVIFWTGEGDNGKSVTQTIFERMLGKLAVKINTNVITGKKQNTGTASPDLVRAGGGVRWLFLKNQKVTNR
jgi:hypothetical protein